nr:unnamed protein product [Callosobruchus analis]
MMKFILRFKMQRAWKLR